MIIRLGRALLPLVAFVALQASLLGGAAACALGEHHTDASDAMAVAAGSRSVDASGSAMADPPPARIGSIPSSPSDDVTNGGAPCEHDRMPERCILMASCAAFVAPAAEQPDGVGASAQRIAPLVALAPGFEAFPPELPPPRA